MERTIRKFSQRLEEGGMERSVDSKHLDRLFIQGNNSMNSLNIILSYNYISNLINLNWYDVLFAIEHGFLSYKAAIDHAIKVIDENSSKDVEELTLLHFEKNTFPYSIHSYIDKLASQVSNKYKLQTKEKLLYVILNWLFENNDNYNDLQNEIDIVYADFNYPESMSNLCSFTKHIPKRYNSIKSPIERLYIEWNIFLKREKDILNCLQSENDL